MIKMLLGGGLGNQMFQYAVGRYLALKHETQLVLDLRFYNNSKDRPYLLDAFNLPVTVVNRKMHRYFHSIPYRIYRRLVERTFYKFHNSKSNRFDADILKLPDNSILTGNFQSDHYFKSIENVIRDEFNLEPFIDKQAQGVINKIENDNYITIHVRRTDYLHHAFSQIDGFENYYANALNIACNQLSDPHVLVFSDDPKWCEGWNLLKKFRVEIITFPDAAQKPLRDLALMSRARTLIMANSTFSWWAAWLNSNYKNIYMPEWWFADQKSIDADKKVDNWCVIKF